MGMTLSNFILNYGINIPITPNLLQAFIFTFTLPSTQTSK
ncbi:hypothetical protein VCHA50O407_30164 [Vibrio chagasii]|nr:hypothetical protein VCHA36O163_40183 [Vibrio chagasii]CAH6979573.1 hypothetical protein VCHA37P191_140077 [Vibrio chagasii]CAH6990931.1 hypothetical protein VCHA35O137_50147 [Vibrio chagasii]CAH7151852.1 hypothetical protein VCHA37P193_20177 [Vibrio chagasii]CAH7188724.1 hypothetical protein VCHA49P382_11197 [Vibrio chagasii]